MEQFNFFQIVFEEPRVRPEKHILPGNTGSGCPVHGRMNEFLISIYSTLIRNAIPVPCGIPYDLHLAVPVNERARERVPPSK